MLAIVIKLVTLPIAKVKGVFEAFTCLAHGLLYYLMLGVLHSIRVNWIKDYPYIAFGSEAMILIVVSCWAFAHYTNKIRQTNEANSRFREIDRTEEAHRANSDQWLNAYEDLESFRAILPWYLGSSVAGGVMAILGTFAPQLFMTAPVALTLVGLGYIQRVPLLAGLLAIAGLFMAVTYIFKTGSVLLGAGYATKEAIVERRNRA
ncbi:MAG: hypothetical protein JNM34_11910 [Chthonomonadaceae bacterium]|nr:hypothetical protein [Chthonomonadaceae bacterium]